MSTILLKVIVGSRAHGLAGPESDYDYRGVFLHPTSHILSIGAKPKQTDWVEGVPLPAGVEDTARGKAQIGNNHGRINGWIRAASIFGRLVEASW